VRINVPKRGRRRELLEVAAENAAETLRALKVAHRTESESEFAQAAMEELASALDLPKQPRRVECYDISNLQGTHTVGSMVVFQDAAPLRQDYRHFRIKTVLGSDDYAAMGEVLRRRFQRLAAFRSSGAEVGRKPGAFERAPDLVIVDGGKGQLSVAVATLQALGLDDLQLVALAKKEELLFRPGRADPVRLPRDSRALHLVQRARDEAHRFAVAYNRKLRRDRGLRSSLDEIPGVGAKRRRVLLTHFGSLDAIRVASVDDIAALPGLTRRVAEQIKAYL
jgi:excinuclease ABC subunit C